MLYAANASLKQATWCSLAAVVEHVTARFVAPTLRVQ